MSWIVFDVVDYKGFPINKSKIDGWVLTTLILGLYFIQHDWVFDNEKS